MQFKYFTLAISTSLCLSIPGPANAQQPTPVPTFYLRFWNMLPPDAGKFDLYRFQKPLTRLISNAVSYRCTSYQDFSLGRFPVAVFKGNVQQTPLKVLNLNPKLNSYFTVLISPAGIELLDDTDNPKVSTGTLVLRNYFPGTTVAVNIGSQPAISLAYGKSISLTDQPRGVQTVALKTVLPTGKPAQAQVDVDLGVTKQVTLLIIPDSYGRFRPRATPDGLNP